MAADNFYTTDPKGKFPLKAGYQYYGIACYVFANQVKDTVPVYSAILPSSGIHFYTTERPEFDHAVQQLGYKAKSVGWFMFGPPSNHTPLFRYYDSKVIHHLYVTTAGEPRVKDFSTYVKVGVAGYILDRNDAAEDGTRAVPLYWWHKPA